MRYCCAVLLMLLLASCQSGRGLRPEDIPTPAEVNGVATAQVLTQNAPPEGFRDTVSYPQVDAGLRDLPGWRYLVELSFDGVFTRTPRQTSATARAEVWFNQLGSARRMMVETAGELIGQREDAAYEAVRLGPDAFLVQNNVCLGIDTPDAAAAADLSAGELVGGVENAVPTGRKAVLNGAQAWEYGFTQADLRLPSIRLADGGSMTLIGGELWVAPEFNTVVRFYVTMDVQNTLIFNRQLPVDGQVIIRYDLFDIGVAPNITVPFGC